jgi:toxin ParE1/3/4
MSRIIQRPLALQDLDEIWDYIAVDNLDAADQFVDMIEEKCRLLAKFPKIGASCESLHPPSGIFQLGNT